MYQDYKRIVFRLDAVSDRPKQLHRLRPFPADDRPARADLELPHVHEGMLCSWQPGRLYVKSADDIQVTAGILGCVVPTRALLDGRRQHIKAEVCRRYDRTAIWMFFRRSSHRSF